jgi:hypothetical protein
MMEGGWAMWFVLAYGFLSAAQGALYAVRRRKGYRALALWGSVATAATIFWGFCLNFAAVFKAAGGLRHPELVQEIGVVKLVCIGTAEALAPGILGFALIAIAVLCVGLGDQRSGAPGADSA